MHFFLQMTLAVGMMFLIDTSPLILAEEPPTELFSQQHEERIVLETIDRFVHYWNQDEAMKLSQMFMINGDFLSPSGMNAHSRKEIQRLITEERQETFQETSLETTVQSVNFPEETLAIVKGRYELKGLSLGLGIMDMSSEGTFLFNLQQQDGKWMILEARIKT